jgi:integrase
LSTARSRSIEPSTARRNNEGAETKTVKDKEPRTFGIEPNLLPLLRAMHDESGGRGRVFPGFHRQRDLAEDPRAYMKLAGVTRAELFIIDETRLNLRFHDLRASTVTWMAVRQDRAERIMQRVGHEDWPAMKKYMRTAEALAPGFGDVF